MDACVRWGPDSRCLHILARKWITPSAVRTPKLIPRDRNRLGVLLIGSELTNQFTRKHTCKPKPTCNNPIDFSIAPRSQPSSESPFTKSIFPSCQRKASSRSRSICRRRHCDIARRRSQRGSRIESQVVKRTPLDIWSLPLRASSRRLSPLQVRHEAPGRCDPAQVSSVRNVRCMRARRSKPRLSRVRVVQLVPRVCCR